MRAAVALLTAAMLAACAPQQPRTPLPPDAALVRTPDDMAAPWLDNQEAAVRDALLPHFGRLSSSAYRVQGSWTWEALVRHFEQSLVPPLQRHEGVPKQGRHHRLLVWSHGGRDGAPMVALAMVEPPASASASAASATHRVLLVMTPRID